MTPRSKCHDCAAYALDGKSRCARCAERKRAATRGERRQSRGDTPRACQDCSVPFPPDTHLAKRRCEPCRKAANNASHRRRYVAGRVVEGSAACVACGGELVQPESRGRTRLRCVECNKPKGPRPATGCVNPRCQVTIESPSANQKWCSRQCRYRVQDIGPRAALRWARKNAKRRPDGRAGAGWTRLRRQVLAEEPACWVCEDEIDRNLRFPHPMSGSADHVVPLEVGGEILDRENVRAAHLECNRIRHIQWRRDRRKALRGAQISA